MPLLKTRSKTVPPASEPDRLIVKLFPPSIEAVGAKPVSMVPGLLLLLVVLVVVCGPSMQAGTQTFGRMFAGVYEHVMVPDQKPPDEDH